jgi:hypothetical protein
MITYKQDPENHDVILWNDGEGTSGFIRKGQIKNDVDLWQELLNKEEAGEIEIDWLTTEQKEAHTAEKAQEQINADSQKYLDDTDKFFTRYKETGKPMPEGMTEARQAARDAIVRDAEVF